MSKINNGPVVTICYGKRREWKTRKQAMKHFYECMTCSCGAERDRYFQIHMELTDGCTIATDGQPETDFSGYKPLSKKDRARMEELKVTREDMGEKLDAVRAVIEAKRSEFEKSIANLLEEEDRIHKEWSDTTGELFRLQKIDYFTRRV